jgi:hypothetical protein
MMRKIREKNKRKGFSRKKRRNWRATNAIGPDYDDL